MDGSRPGKPPSLAETAAAAADPCARAPRGRGRERRRHRGAPPSGAVRVQRRAAAERGTAARRLGAPEGGGVLVETFAAPVALAAGPLVLLDVELRIGHGTQDLA